MFNHAGLNKYGVAYKLYMQKQHQLKRQAFTKYQVVTNLTCDGGFHVRNINNEAKDAEGITRRTQIFILDTYEMVLGCKLYKDKRGTWCTLEESQTCLCMPMETSYLNKILTNIILQVLQQKLHMVL